MRQSALAALRYVVERLRTAFPSLEFKIRADNGFACPELYDYCEDERVEYFVNLGTHAKMVAHTGALQRRAIACFNAVAKTAPVQVFGEFEYQARTWIQVRRIVSKAAHTLIGEDQRLLVTTSKLAPVEVRPNTLCLRILRVAARVKQTARRRRVRGLCLPRRLAAPRPRSRGRGRLMQARSWGRRRAPVPRLRDVCRQIAKSPCSTTSRCPRRLPHALHCCRPRLLAAPDRSRTLPYE